jgi:hypothetical protein
LVDFRLPLDGPKIVMVLPMLGSKVLLFWHVIMVRFWTPPNWPKMCSSAPVKLPTCAPGGFKRPQDPPKSTPRGGKSAPGGLKRPQEPVKKAQSPPKSSQQPPKMPTRFFRSTWYGSRCRKNGKNHSARALSGLSRCPPSFSEAPGPAAVFGKIKK